MLKPSLIARTAPVADEHNIYVRGNTRFTVICDRLIRVENSPTGEFLDLATQAVWFRDCGKVEFEVREIPHGCIIKTDKVIFSYSDSKQRVTSVTFTDTYRTVPCSNANNLKGTARTLDMTAGFAKLDNGIMSTDGVGIIDDSKSFVLLDNGEVAPRTVNERDVYIFAYGRDYRGALKAFYSVSGRVPLVPRYALGNWWSRYYAYTQDEYQSLMQRFEDEDIPFTVATVDMDWHWVDVDKMLPHEKKSTLNPFQSLGWTGYSWNTELFPDYRAFLDFLHSKSLHVTLNLHPRDGVRSHESMYEKMARANGIDPETGQAVKFRLADTNFWNTYFDIVHKPYEKDGVDFWWIDWQQGTKLDVKGLDPLWVLNHYHFLDNAEDGRMPLILSRYAGIGSHRYPLGFSGDSVICWNSLKFQPYFTTNAANVGYTWWSHDIGGHTLGVRDDDLYIRWLQFGVFSPIMRLHSSSDDLLGKEPWRYKDEVRFSAIKFLRLRHRMIPYIYTADMLTHTDSVPLCEPLYYRYPDEPQAYKLKNEYFFGRSLLCAPITEKQNKNINMAGSEVWLPEGRWTDIFTNRIYHGGKTVKMFRGLDSFPVLACEGAIIPLSSDSGNYCGNPKSLELLIYRGSGDYSLYEDSGKTDFETKHAYTPFSVRADSASLSFRISPAEGDISVLPESRSYKLSFKDIIKYSNCEIYINGEKYDGGILSCSGGNFSVSLSGIAPTDSVLIKLGGYTPLKNESVRERIINVFSRLQSRTLIKDALYAPFKNVSDAETAAKLISRLPLDSDVKSALYECLAD